MRVVIFIAGTAFWRRTEVLKSRTANSYRYSRIYAMTEALKRDLSLEQLSGVKIMKVFGFMQ